MIPQSTFLTRLHSWGTCGGLNSHRVFFCRLHDRTATATTIASTAAGARDSAGTITRTDAMAMLTAMAVITISAFRAVKATLRISKVRAPVTQTGTTTADGNNVDTFISDMKIPSGINGTRCVSLQLIVTARAALHTTSLTCAHLRTRTVRPPLDWNLGGKRPSQRRRNQRRKRQRSPLRLQNIECAEFYTTLVSLSRSILQKN